MTDQPPLDLFEDHVAAATTYVLQLREDWSAVQVSATVEACRNHRDRPTDEQIARALMRAAADPSVRSPRYVPASRSWLTLDTEVGPAGGQTGSEPHECRACGQPGSASRPPAFCPACGEAWTPITPSGEDVSNRAGLTACTHCHHRQAGRFTYCARCGAAMAYPRPAGRPA